MLFSVVIIQGASPTSAKRSARKSIAGKHRPITGRL